MKRRKIIIALAAVYVVIAVGVMAADAWSDARGGLGWFGSHDGKNAGAEGSGDAAGAGNSRADGVGDINKTELPDLTGVEQEYPLPENGLVYGALGKSEMYMVSGDVLLAPNDTTSLLEVYSMPALERMNPEDAEQYMSRLQVFERIEKLGLNPDAFFTPEYAWKAIYNASLTGVRDALAFEGAAEDTAAGISEDLVVAEVTFTGSSASELNAFLKDCSRVIVKIGVEQIVLDESIRVPSNVILQGNDVQIVGVNLGTEEGAEGEAQGAPAGVPYGMLLDGAENVGIYNFRLLGGFEQGIYIIASKDCLIWGNEISGGLGKPLSVMGDSSRINLVNNVISGNGSGGIFLNGDIRNCIIQGNSIYQNHGTGNQEAGIVLSSAWVEDLYTPFNEFRDEYLYELLEAPHQNVILDNLIQGNYSSGFYSDGGYLNYVMDNCIEDNEKEGLCLDYGAFGNYVTGNSIRRNGERDRQTDEDLEADFVLGAGRLEDGTSPAKLPGISLDNAAYNIVFENVISDNSGSGVKIVRSGYRNVILANIISDNNRGENEFFHGYGIEFGHAGTPDEPVKGLDFTPDYENIAARNVISGTHYAGIFLAEGSYCNDLIDNVIMEAQAHSVESKSRLFNSTVGNVADK